MYTQDEEGPSHFVDLVANVGEFKHAEINYVGELLASNKGPLAVSFLFFQGPGKISRRILHVGIKQMGD